MASPSPPSRTSTTTSSPAERFRIAPGGPARLWLEWGSSIAKRESLRGSLAFSMVAQVRAPLLGANLGPTTHSSPPLAQLGRFFLGRAKARLNLTHDVRGWPRFAPRFWALTWAQEYSFRTPLRLPLPITRRPFGLDFDDSFFSQRVVTKTAPRPVLRTLA